MDAPPSSLKFHFLASSRLSSAVTLALAACCKREASAPRTACRPLAVTDTLSVLQRGASYLRTSRRRRAPSHAIPFASSPMSSAHGQKRPCWGPFRARIRLHRGEPSSCRRRCGSSAASPRAAGDSDRDQTEPRGDATPRAREKCCHKKEKRTPSSRWPASRIPTRP